MSLSEVDFADHLCVRMKYLLACLNRLFQLYGSDLTLGYDIACAFMKTVLYCSLSPKAT